MRWTLGLLLLAGAGCGYRQTKMVACPETGCSQTYAESSPEGLRGPGERRAERATAAEVGLPNPPPPVTPLPEHESPPTPPPVYTPSP
jgi:hypothetical protein